MKLKALLTSLIVLGSAEVADPISEASRYKTWGREVLTHADLNALQDHFAGKINEIIVATADSNYQKMTVDTLTAAHSVTVANVELSKTTHGHADVHYTETEIDATLGGYAVFSHGHTAGTILSDNKTGTGKFVFHTSPVLAGTPKVSESGADYRIWHAGPSGMGAASGLHADILDSQEGAYYAATGAEGAVQFRKSDGSFHNSSNFGYLVESGSGTSQLAVGGAAASNMELTVGQPSGATTANTEIYIRADSGENASLELAEGDDRRQTVTMTGSNDGLIIGPHPATAANGIMVSSSGKVGVEASPDGTADLTLGSGGVKFSDATTLTSANHAHSGLVDDGGNSGTNGVSVSTTTGNVGIEVAPGSDHDLTVGDQGIKVGTGGVVFSDNTSMTTAGATTGHNHSGTYVGDGGNSGTNGVSVNTASGNVGIEVAPGAHDLTVGDQGLKVGTDGIEFSDGTDMTTAGATAGHGHSGFVSDGGNSGTDGVSVNTTTGNVGVEVAPGANHDLTIGDQGIKVGTGGIEFSDGTDMTTAGATAGHNHSGTYVSDGGNSGTNGVSVNTSTGNVGIEVAPDGSADLTLGSGGLKFASDPGYDFTQVSGYTRWGNDSGTAKGKGNGTSSLSGNKTINHVFTDAEINQAFTRNYGAVVFDNESDSDPTNFAIYVDADGDGDEAGEYGNLVFYHSNIPTGSGAAGAVLAVNEYGISVGGKQKSSSYSLNVDGSGLFSGSVQENSDARYKENTQPLTGALDKVKTLDAFSYQWQTGSPVGAVWVNRDSTTKAQYLGVSAQELQAVYPNLVTGSDASGYSVNYSRLTVVLLAAIQELEARVATLEAQ